MESYSYATANSLYYGLLKEFVKQNKKNPTLAEQVLWEYLRKSQMGVPFRKQHIIDCYIADFFCFPAKLIIEVDGGYHQLPEQQESDELRTQRLHQLGYTVLRFTNEEVLYNINDVINEIRNHICQKTRFQK